VGALSENYRARWRDLEEDSRPERGVLGRGERVEHAERLAGERQAGVEGDTERNEEAGARAGRGSARRPLQRVHDGDLNIGA
jgi:hypothetical protein